jgi:hypothetical protein
MSHTVAMTFIRSLEQGAVCTLLCFWPILATGSTPVPTYGTYFGGTGDTNVAVAVAVAMDPSGNIVVAGYTTSQTLPGTANAFQPTKATGFPDNQDVFIAKFNPPARSQIVHAVRILVGD